MPGPSDVHRPHRPVRVRMWRIPVREERPRRTRTVENPPEVIESPSERPERPPKAGDPPHMMLVQRHFYGYVRAAIGRRRNHVARYWLAIYRQIHGIARPFATHCDLVRHAAEPAHGVETRPPLRNRGCDLQAIVGGTYPENPLHDGVVIPRRGAGQPGVLGFAMGGRVAPGDHLRVDTRLAAVHVADWLARRRVDARIVIVRAVAIAGHGLGDDHPRVVVTENSRVFLVARRVGRNLAEVQVVARVRRLLQHDAMRRGQVLAHGFERAARQPVFDADARQNAETLRLDEDLSLGALLRSDLVAEVVVRAQEPLAVPAVPADGFLHARAFGQITGGFVCMAAMPR